MKKMYFTPSVEKISFNYSNQVVASGANNCYWKNDGYWSHGTSSCHDDYVEGTATQVPA